MPVIINGTTGITNVDGSASAPAETGTTSVTTGFYYGANTVGISTAGTNALFIDSSRNVGIGQTSPNARLEINNSSNGAEVARFEGLYTATSTVTLANFRRSGGAVAAAIRYNDSANNIDFGTTTAHSFALRTNSTTALTIDTSQNVGIGTTTPGSTWTAKMAVVGSVASGGQNYSVTFTDGINTVFKIGHQTNLTNLVNDGALALYTASTERVRIDLNGNFGLGVTPSTNWSSSTKKVIQLGLGGLLYGDTVQGAQMILGANWSFDGTTIRYLTTAAASYYQQNGGTHSWFTAPSGTANTTATFTTAMTLDTSFNLTVTGTITESSSITIKENVDPITNALDKVSKLTGVTYDRKDGTAKNRAGLIAEEVEKILPNVVQKDSNGGTSGIHYTNLIAYLVESIKELKQEIDELRKK